MSLSPLMRDWSHKAIPGADIQDQGHHASSLCRASLGS
jgi:hypothetical protein